MDQVVSGVILLARTSRAASDLSAQIREGGFRKTYLAVCHGLLPGTGSFTDLLYRDTASRTTRIAAEPGRGVQAASLEYETLAQTEDASLVRIQLLTGRTHQIRAQFSGHGHPLFGDRKYGITDGSPEIALWSHRIDCFHPRTKEPLCFSAFPSPDGAWSVFTERLNEYESNERPTVDES